MWFYNMPLVLSACHPLSTYNGGVRCFPVGNEKREFNFRQIPIISKADTLCFLVLMEFLISEIFNIYRRLSRHSFLKYEFWVIFLINC